MWLTDGFSVTFFGRWWGAVRIHVSHIQLPYTVIYVWWWGTFTCESSHVCHVQLPYTVIYVWSWGTLTCESSHVCHIQLPYTVIYVWWWGTFACASSHVCHVQLPYTLIYLCHVHSNLCVVVGGIHVCDFSRVSHTANGVGN